MTGLERIQRILLIAVQMLLAVSLLLCVVDAVVFRVRLARGGGIQTQQVDQFLSTPLKDGKVELDYLGTGQQNCASALLPQYVSGQWMTPCWWLKRHSNQWQ